MPHIFDNIDYLYALEQGLVPIGTQEADLLDTRNSDEDADSVVATLLNIDEDATAVIEISPIALDKGELNREFSSTCRFSLSRICYPLPTAI